MPVADSDDTLSQYFRGEKLYGDDFSPEEIDAWFKDEEQGYFNLLAEENDPYDYQYHVLNQQHGFRFLPARPLPQILGVGSAYGNELAPIAQRSEHITIIEPADGFRVREIAGTPVTYRRPESHGTFPFPDNHFDLITCFGVLHHIPNVSKLLGEFYRCAKRDCYVLIREPIVSMGDWRKSRPGLTKRERGIPLKIFRESILLAGFDVVSERKCAFSLIPRLRFMLGRSVYNSRFAVWLDNKLCGLPIWSDKYHATNVLQKLRPSSVFYVLRKP